MRFPPFFILFVLAAGALSGTVRMTISDLFPASLAEELSAEFAALEVEARVNRGGSMLTMDALRAGEIDAAIIALPDENIPEGPYLAQACAYQVITILVHESNPVQQVSLDQLRMIYAEGGAIDEWGRLGGTGTWSARRITPNAVRKPENVGLEVFRYHVLQEAPMRSATRYRSSIRAALAEVSDDNTAIAVLPAARPDARGRTLFVAADTESQAYSPTPDNVMFGDYPLRLPFFLIHREDLETAKVRAVKRAVFSDRFGRGLREADFMPLPERERRDRLMEAEGMTE